MGQLVVQAEVAPMFASLTLFSPDFYTGIAFASLLLCAGMSLGLWLGRKNDAPQADGDASRQALQVVSGLTGWTETFASDVAQYRETIALFARRLAEFEQRPDHQTASMLMGRVAEANECLQRRIEAAEEALQKQASDISSYLQEARTDALTGLPNRRSFDDEFQRRLAQWRRKRVPFSLMLLDVDRFKLLNDTHGHPAGDAVLSEVGRLLRENLEEGEAAARFGGEEFAVLLPCDDEQALANAYARFSQAISSCEIPFEQQTLRVTISAGAAVAEESELGPHLVKRADEALYAAKRGGRNRGYWHDGEQHVPLGGSMLDGLVASLVEAADQVTPGAVQREVTTSAEFREVCSDLRRKLQELTLGPRQA